MDCSLQASPSMGFSRQEYWSGVPLPSPGDLPDPEIEPMSPMLQADALPSEPPEKLCLRVLHKTKTKVIATMTSWLEVLVKKPHLCTSKLLAKFCFFALLRLMSPLVAVSWELLSTSRGCPHLFSQGASTFKLAMARWTESLLGFEALLLPPLPPPGKISAFKGLTFWG